MKRIVMCFDGTWNKPADESSASDRPVETNVCRFFESIRERDEIRLLLFQVYEQIEKFNQVN